MSLDKLLVAVGRLEVGREGESALDRVASHLGMRCIERNGRDRLEGSPKLSFVARKCGYAMLSGGRGRES